MQNICALYDNCFADLDTMNAVQTGPMEYIPAILLSKENTEQKILNTTYLQWKII
jgi:hypothetical protein